MDELAGLRTRSQQHQAHHFQICQERREDHRCQQHGRQQLYPSERYDGDMQFLGRFKTIKIAEQGVNLDIDKTAIAKIPAYVARQSTSTTFGNPFPQVMDFTEVNKTGTHQTEAAAALTPFDKNINSALYFHTDYVSVDDSLAGQVTPGKPGSSAVANTLIEWVLKRSVGRAKVPTPKSLGVMETY